MNLHHNHIDILKEIQSLDDNTILKGKDHQGVSYLKHIFQLHELLFGETCTGCASKIPSYIKRIKSYQMKKKEQKVSEFVLKSKVTIPVFGTSEVYTTHNITDEIALELIKANPNRKSLFIKLPSNLDELILSQDSKPKGDKDQGNNNETLEVFSKHLTIDEIKGYLKTIGVKTQAKKIDSISKKLDELDKDQLKALEDEINKVDNSQGTGENNATNPDESKNQNDGEGKGTEDSKE